AERSDLAEHLVGAGVRDPDVRHGQHFHIYASGGGVHPGVVRPDVGDWVDVVLLAALAVDLAEHRAGLGVDDAPGDLAPQRQTDSAAVRRHPEAVGVLAQVLAPDDRVGGEIDRDELVAAVRGHVESPELRAGADSLVVAAAGNGDRTNERVAAIDIVHA